LLLCFCISFLCSNEFYFKLDRTHLASVRSSLLFPTLPFLPFLHFLLPFPSLHSSSPYHFPFVPTLSLSSIPFALPIPKPSLHPEEGSQHPNSCQPLPPSLLSPVPPLRLPFPSPSLLLLLLLPLHTQFMRRKMSRRQVTKGAASNHTAACIAARVIPCCGGVGEGGVVVKVVVMGW
jgi:hypothetical protein